MTEQPKFSPEIIAKAKRLLGKRNADGAPAMIQDSEYPNVWWVTPSSGSSNRYRVHTDWSPTTGTLTWITCTCPHGMNRGGGTTRCYHAAAVLLLIREQQLGADHLGGGRPSRRSTEGRRTLTLWDDESERDSTPAGCARPVN